jgi:hypothetical protein
MKEVINSTSITNSVASGTIASSSVAMLREELTGEVRKRHGNNNYTLPQTLKQQHDLSFHTFSIIIYLSYLPLLLKFLVAQSHNI